MFHEFSIFSVPDGKFNDQSVQSNVAMAFSSYLIRVSRHSHKQSIVPLSMTYTVRLVKGIKKWKSVTDRAQRPPGRMTTMMR